MRGFALATLGVLWTVASCERSLEGLACESGIHGRPEYPGECASGYTCCDGVCVSKPSPACFVAAAGNGSGAGQGGHDGSPPRGGGPSSGAHFGGTPNSEPAPGGAAGSSTAGAKGHAGSRVIPEGGHPAVAGTSGANPGGQAGTQQGGQAGTQQGGQGATSAGGAGGAQDPSPCRDCDLIRLTHDAPTVTIGGPGGKLFADVCPADQVLIGIQANAGPAHVTGIAALCGHVDIVADAVGSPTVAMREGAVLPKRGGASGAHLVSRCPAGEVVTGFDTAFDIQGEAHMMRRLRLFCAPLVVRSDGSLPKVEVGTETPLEPMLDWAENNGIAGPVQCRPAIGRGLLTRAGSWVDAFAIACAVPEIARRDGSPCTNDAHCTSGRCSPCSGDGCERTCQPFECPAPAGCMCSVWDSKHYLFCSQGLAHDAAKQACEDTGGHLLYVGSQSENGWARATASGWAAMAGEFWLGADDLAEEGVFRWADGTLADEQLGFWPTDSLPGEERDCLQLNSDGQWLSGHCNDARPYVCEHEPVRE